MVAEAVYILCAMTSAACAMLLFRAFCRNRTRLLLWSSLCFVGLSINNALLFADKVILPTVDLSIWRMLSALLALCVLLYGLIWDSE